MIKTWKHKTNGKIFRATPWWEVPDNESDKLVETEEEIKFIDKVRKVKTKIGVMYQVGWLINNEHDVWFGVSLDAEDMFEDLGLEVKKEDSK